MSFKKKEEAQNASKLKQMSHKATLLSISSTKNAQELTQQTAKVSTRGPFKISRYSHLPKRPLLNDRDKWVSLTVSLALQITGSRKNKKDVYLFIMPVRCNRGEPLFWRWCRNVTLWDERVLYTGLKIDYGVNSSKVDNWLIIDKRVKKQQESWLAGVLCKAHAIVQATLAVVVYMVM